MYVSSLNMERVIMVTDDLLELTIGHYVWSRYSVETVCTLKFNHSTLTCTHDLVLVDHIQNDQYV